MSTSTSSNTNAVMLLFDRPCQPIFQPKGKSTSTYYDVPSSYYEGRYKNVAEELSTRIGASTNVISVKELTTLPDLTVPMSLDRRANFSVFNDFHKQCASSLITTLMGIKTIEDFVSACVYIQQRVNPYLYIYALSVATIHRTDTKNIPIPSQLSVFPELFVDSTVLNTARQEYKNINNEAQREAIEIPRDYTASDRDIEHRVAYFREDIGANLGHYHWHLVYPLDGPTNIVNKDRRGELFYHVHRQILARYNAERFCNDLPRVTRLNNLREPIKEGYFPKLDTLVASRVWPARQENAILSDLNREVDGLSTDISDMERWRDRIYEAIHRGSVYQGTQLVQLTESGGIDVLGNMIEANALSINRTLYGNLHNQGHMMLGYIHDPDNRYLETYGIMGDPTTTMRDPVFFRWHSFIDDIFEEHKRTLPAYTTAQLEFQNVAVTKVEVKTDGVTDVNNLWTYWERDQVDLSRGLDFQPRGSVFASFVHLQNRPFTYTITATNKGSQTTGTVRIFLSPKYDEVGRTFRFMDQRFFLIEMDRFTTTLKSGTNTITRTSAQSSLTIPFVQTFRSLDNAPTGGSELDGFNYCGCGWPNYMLLPRGTAQGFRCELFVMISNYKDDKVDGANTTGANCVEAVSFCGARSGKYPDKRAMGFPFDRRARTGVVTLANFLTSNMLVQDINIYHADTVRNGRTIPTTSTTATTNTATTTSRTTASATTATRTTTTTSSSLSKPRTNTGRN